MSCDTSSCTSAIPQSVCRAEPRPQSAVSPHPLCLLELPGEELYSHPVHRNTVSSPSAAIYSNTVCDERGSGLLVELHGVM